MAHQIFICIYFNLISIFIYYFYIILLYLIIKNLGALKILGPCAIELVARAQSRLWVQPSHCHQQILQTNTHYAE